MNNGQYGYEPLNFESLIPSDKPKRRIFSRVHLALFLFLISSYAVILISEIILAVALPYETYLDIVLNPVYSVLISTGGQYLVGFPVFLLVLGRGEKQVREKSKLRPSRFFFAFLAAQALMYAGNLIGTAVSSSIGGLLGRLPENAVTSLVSEVPIPLLILTVVIIAPITEEFMFRKLIFDRLSVFGDRIAILFSAIAFALLHGNLYQLFYAFFLGIVLGYLYAKTRNILYPILLHFIINLMGSVVGLGVMEAMEVMYEGLEALSLGESVNTLAFLLSTTLTLLYALTSMAFIGGGIAVIIIFFRRREHKKISRDGKFYLPRERVFAVGVGNVGTILFYSLSAIFILLNLLL